MRGLFVALLALAWAGCDSNGSDDDDRSDAEVFLGTWTLTGVDLNGTSAYSALVLAVVDVAADFGSTGAFTMTVETEEDGQPVTETFTGTYQIDEGNNTITLVSDDFQSESVTLDYDVAGGGDRVTISTDDGVLLASLVDVDLDSFVEGGVQSFALTFERAGVQ